MKYFLFLFFIFCFNAHAESCPTVEMIQHTNLKGWRALSIESARPLSDIELKKFSHNLQAFYQAEWMQDASEGNSHCYYFDDNHLLSPFFLAKNNFCVKDTPSWKKINNFLYQCKQSIEKCVFSSI